MESLRWKSLSALSLAFGVTEAALVTVYRGLLDPAGNAFPLIHFPIPLLPAEQLRELATIALLASAARLLSSRPTTAFAAFLVGFSLWDLSYYAVLRLLLGWPRGLGDWDLLFLVPVPWMAPVWAPMAVSLVMLAVGGLSLHHESRRGALRVGWPHAFTAFCGGALCLLSFVHDGAARQLDRIPERYPVEYLIAGLGLGLAAYAHAWWRSRRVELPA